MTPPEQSGPKPYYDYPSSDRRGPDGPFYRADVPGETRDILCLHQRSLWSLKGTSHGFDFWASAP